jgi:5,10-methylenetetrahydromethanopterin reductase
MRRIGIAFPGQPYSLRETIATAQSAEAAGFESVWVAEDCWTGRDAISVLSCLALSTRTIAVGTSVVNPYIRHPVLTAMTFHTLAEIAKGRLRIGIASGLPWKPLVETQMAAWPPLRAMRESVDMMRNLLRGETLHFGEERVRLGVQRKCFEDPMEPHLGAMPVYMGASGPKMTQLAGEIADGLLLGTGTSPGEVRARRSDLETGAARASRNIDSIDLGVLIVSHCSRDGGIHPNTLGYVVKSLVQQKPEGIAELGFDLERVERIRDAYARDDCPAAFALLTRSMIDEFVVAGTVDDGLRTLDRYSKAGMTLPLLLPFGGSNEGIIELGKAYVAQI